MANINELVGKTLVNIIETRDEILFTTSDGDTYKMYHFQDCCESVSVEDVNGDWDDLKNTPILVAEEREYDGAALCDWDESFTWTFYTIRTIKGSVDIRWYGSSNGYYGEGVDFDKV